ncbi:MAG: PKD domain-containing protein [Puia sp.]
MYCNSQYRWSFGDGTGIIGDTVTHHYNEYGNYTVCLKITDLNGVSDSSCYNLSLQQEFTDINDRLVYGSIYNIDTGRYFCRRDAYFTSGDTDGQFRYSVLGYSINAVHGNNIFATPGKGNHRTGKFIRSHSWNRQTGKPHFMKRIRVA